VCGVAVRTLIVDAPEPGFPALLVFDTTDTPLYRSADYVDTSLHRHSKTGDDPKVLSDFSAPTYIKA